MQLQLIHGFGSFDVAPTLDELPSFLVVTGENGSGKSQFLRALSNGSMHGGWEYPSEPVVLLTTEQLGAPISAQNMGMTRRTMVDQFEQMVTQSIRPNGAFNPAAEPGLYVWLHRQLGISEDVIRASEHRAGKPLKDWIRTDYDQHTPFEHGQSLTDWSVADTFQRYSAMKTVNDFNQWLDSQGKPHDPWLSEDEFIDVHGPAPWDLLNEVLTNVGLAYQFPPPAVSIEEVPYVPRLVSEREELVLTPEELSSGEKTLIQIALSVYSGLYRAGTSRVPKAVLFDEPDATLHPSMIRSMLQLVQEVLVNRLGITVIMTTHSPTTVALAQEPSLYLMERSTTPRLKKATRDDALRRLLVGVPTVSVSAEHRRVVFTESPIDASRYTELFSILRPLIDSERTLTFVSVGSTDGRDDGCAAVIGMVEKLRSHGNLAVWGLVDRDRRDAEPAPGVHFNPQGYSIENLVLDPLSVGLLLLADGDELTRHAVPNSTFVQFQAADAQPLVDAVISKVFAGRPTEPRVPIVYRDGTTVEVNMDWMNIRGHDLEEMILDALPTLLRYRHNHRFVPTVIQRVWAQDPRRVPKSVVDTFERLLRD